MKSDMALLQSMLDGKERKMQELVRSTGQVKSLEGVMCASACAWVGGWVGARSDRNTVHAAWQGAQDAQACAQHWIGEMNGKDHVYVCVYVYVPVLMTTQSSTDTNIDKAAGGVM